MSCNFYSVNCRWLSLLPKSNFDTWFLLLHPSTLVCGFDPAVCSSVHVVVVVSLFQKNDNCFNEWAIYTCSVTSWGGKVAAWWQWKQDYQCHPLSVSFGSSPEAGTRPWRNKRRWFDSLSPANGLHIHFIYSSARSQQYGAADGWRRKMTKRKENHCLTLDSGWLLFLAKAAIITRATSNKIVQARLGN